MITCKCGQAAVVQWKRRPFPDEASRLVERAPDTSAFIPVYACADHALTPAAAALTHQASCTGPGKTAACDCTPEQEPVPDFPGDPAKPKKRLPPGW
ncbi:hypothetical protein ACIA6C_28240 [Streptomyces sp. NPDC051578]|uniref:hypothetical protein n=1 Tax=Streptomyces sp. NPDC051578 TaxID=3365662 RepID=UPI00379EBD33